MEKDLNKKLKFIRRIITKNFFENSKTLRVENIYIYIHAYVYRDICIQIYIYTNRYFFLNKQNNYYKNQKSSSLLHNFITIKIPHKIHPNTQKLQKYRKEEAKSRKGTSNDDEVSGESGKWKVESRKQNRSRVTRLEAQAGNLCSKL